LPGAGEARNELPEPAKIERLDAASDAFGSCCVVAARVGRAIDEGFAMPKIIAAHQVDDVAHWLSSRRRVEVFGDLAHDIQTSSAQTSRTSSG
jgi:hypothetical protein